MGASGVPAAGTTSAGQQRRCVALDGRRLPERFAPRESEGGERPGMGFEQLS